jgi:hypothetical protein
VIDVTQAHAAHVFDDLDTTAQVLEVTLLIDEGACHQAHGTLGEENHHTQANENQGIDDPRASPRARRPRALRCGLEFRRGRLANRGIYVEGQKLLVQICKQLIDDPELWAIYDESDQQAPKDDGSFQGKLRGFAHLHLNMFEIMFSGSPENGNIL